MAFVVHLYRLICVIFILLSLKEPMSLYSCVFVAFGFRCQENLESQPVSDSSYWVRDLCENSAWNPEVIGAIFNETFQNKVFARLASFCLYSKLQPEKASTVLGPSLRGVYLNIPLLQPLFCEGTARFWDLGNSLSNGLSSERSCDSTITSINITVFSFNIRPCFPIWTKMKAFQKNLMRYSHKIEFIRDSWFLAEKVLN